MVFKEKDWESLGFILEVEGGKDILINTDGDTWMATVRSLTRDGSPGKFKVHAIGKTSYFGKITHLLDHLLNISLRTQSRISVASLQETLLETRQSLAHLLPTLGSGDPPSSSICFSPTGPR